MTVYIDENDMSFFQSDGYSQEDIQNTVNHYRSSGMSDELIQNKINERLNELKLNSNNVRTNEQNSNQPKMLQGAVMYTTPKKNPIDRFRECLDWVGKTAMSAYQEGREQVEVADLEIKNMLGLDNSLDKASLNELSNKQPKQYHNFGVRHSSDYIDENITNVIPRTRDAIAKSYIEALKMLPYMWETIKATSGGVAVGSVGGAIVGGVATKTPQGALGGARIGGSWAGRISGSMRLAELEGGLARNELRQINEEIISKGGEPLSDAEINMLAIGVGGVNAGLELVSLKQTLKTVPGGDKILDYFKNKQLRELATNRTVREQLKGVLANYTGAITTEMVTEMAQETTNIIADETARKMGKIENTPLEKNVARILDTGKATFGAMMLMGGVSSTAKVATIYAQQGLTKTQAEKIANQMTPEEKESFIADNMDTLFKSVEDYLKDKDNSIKYADVKNKLYKQIKSTGSSDEEALYNSEIMTKTMAGMVDLDNISIDKVHDMFKMNIQQLSVEDAKAMLKGGIQKNVPTFQSAMYKSPKENFSDFYNQVFEKENDAKANNTTVKKSYFQYNNNGLSVRIPHDTVNHSDKKHNLSEPEWTDVLNNILNIENAGISKTQYSNDNVTLLKISTPNGKYGVSIQFANGTNQISTVFKSTDKGIDEWIEKGSANSSTSEPLTSRDKSHTVAVVSQNLNNIISYVKQKLNPTEFINNNIKENFGYSAEELENNFKSDIKNILEENGVDYDEFEIEDVKLYGSYTTGKNKDTSDLDVIVQYKGSMREDSAFDLLNSEKLTIVDVNGIEREVDINPINSALSGTIEDHIEYMNELDPRFQSAITAGAKQNEVSDAINEWQEKGNKSKYFKRWTDNAPLVKSENANNYNFKTGEKVVVNSYHGTNQDLTYFDDTKKGSATNVKSAKEGFWSVADKTTADSYADFASTEQPLAELKKELEKSEKRQDWDKFDELTRRIEEVELSLLSKGPNERGAKTYELFVKFKNPYVFNAQNRQFVKIQSDINNAITFAKDNGHDGVIITNLQDKPLLGEYGEQTSATHYLAFSNTQIKSVDNRGTFDENNPNIYYQSEKAIEPLDDINQRTDKSKYLTDNEVIRLKKDRENFEIYIKKLLKNELSSKTILQVVQKLPSAYNNIPELRGKKVVVTQSVYKKIIDLPNKFDKNHKVDRKRAIALPTLLSDPLYILQSTSKGHEDRFVVVTNSKGILPKEKLSIILQPDSNVAVVSAYDEAINISEEKKNGRVLYDKKQELSKTVATSKVAMMNNSSNIINDNSRNFNPNEDEKNLLMTHNTKIDNLDDILANGNLIAPSFAITKKDYEVEALSKFGDVTFIRKPSRINFDSDNVYNRDIYSPRMPRPEYQLKDGTVIDSYEKESRERLEKQRPEHYKERFKIPTSEMFKDAKNVMFLGYTPSGNRRYKPYTAENILAYMKKEGLLSGENFDYGLSSLMARFAEKQKDLKQLKESAKDGLYSSENLNKEYENLQKEYDELGDKVAPLYWDKYSFYEFQSDVFFAIAKNKKKYLKDTYNIEVPADLAKEVKDFVTKAQTMPRLYFEAKPMREVSLDEFGYAIARIGTLTNSQREKLENVYHIDVIEYEDNIKEALEQVDRTQTYFQESNNPLDKARGFSIVRQDFDGTIKENLIVLLKGHADKSTLMHEFAHVYLITLNQLAKIDAKAQMNLTTINKYLRYNGVEYTEQQHEKFALGFEAYLRAGKAPTYRLKKAFEHFKSWLHSIYNRIEIGDWQQDLTLDDETKAVFDQILGDSAYSNQVQQAEELIEKARSNGNLLMNMEYANKEKIEPTTLSERQKRFRDVAFDIVYTALHNTKDENGKPYIKDKKELYMLFNTKKEMNRKNKGVFRRAEKLTFILQELDDPFSAGDGILPEWREFFGSYDESDMYDSELALAALDVIMNKKYLYSEMDIVDVITNEDIQHMEYEYDYIINAFKKSKGDDRSIAMLAYWNWVERVPDFVQEDFLNKWERETAEIERYENLDKFQQAKEDLILYAQGMKHHGNYSTQFAEFSRQIIKRLDFLTVQDKAKMWNKFKDYDSFNDMLRDIDSIMDYAQTIEAVSDRKMMANEIDREVQQTIHEWKNGIKKTKYTYPANKLFERLRQIRKMSMEEIEDVYASIVNEESEITYEADKVHDEDYYKTIEKMYIEFRMNGQYYNSSQFLANLLDRIKTAKFTAKVARDEIDFERRMQQFSLLDECKKAVSSHKGKVSKFEQIYSAEFNLNSALEMMFNTAVKDKFTLDYLYSQKDAQVGADRDEVLKKLANVFGLKGAFAEMRLFNIFINMTKPEFKIKQRYSPDVQQGTYRVTTTDKETGKQITEKTIAVRPQGEGYKEWEDEEIELSRMQVLYYYIQTKNPTSYEILTDMGSDTQPAKGQFNKFDFDDMINQLTPQEKMMGDILQLAAEKYYDKLNQYHIEKYHTELGKVKGYYPRKTSSVQEKVYEPFNDYTQSMSNQKFQKQRTAGKGSRIKPANALEVLFTHIEQANTIIIMGKQLDLMNRVFSNIDLKNAIEATWGKNVTNDFYHQIANNLFGGQTSTLTTADGWVNTVCNNVIKSQIFWKPQVGVKQVLSFMNYGVGDEYVSATEWWTEFGKQSLTPQNWKKNVEYMMSIPYLKDRFGRGGSTDALKQQLETRFYAKMDLLDPIFSVFIRYGDMGAIILGGKPYIDILMKKGYSEEQAQRIFIEKTVNDQQSSIPSTLSNGQRDVSKNPLSKMFFAYQNTPHQYFRTAYNSIIRFKQNPSLKSGMEMGKIVAIYMYVFPLIFNMASSLSVAIATGQGDDDELWNDIWKSCIGGFTFIPIAGSFINAIWTGLRGEGVYGGDWFDSATQKASILARHIYKGEVTPMDLYITVAMFGEAMTGKPITAIGTQVSGLVDMAQGKVTKGALKVAGYSDYRAKKVTGEE